MALELRSDLYCHLYCARTVRRDAAKSLQKGMKEKKAAEFLTKDATDRHG
jgi:hypothetical protein